MEYKSNFEFDLKVGQVKEQQIGYILQNETIEVKFDRQAQNTQNVFIEYESRGQPSGIATTAASWYCIAIADTFHLIRTEVLKEKCRKYIGTDRDKHGGDENTSKGILLPIKELLY